MAKIVDKKATKLLKYPSGVKFKSTPLPLQNGEKLCKKLQSQQRPSMKKQLCLEFQSAVSSSHPAPITSFSPGSIPDVCCNKFGKPEPGALGSLMDGFPTY